MKMKRRTLSWMSVVLLLVTVGCMACEKDEVEREYDRQQEIDREQDECERNGGVYYRSIRECNATTKQRG